MTYIYSIIAIWLCVISVLTLNNYSKHKKITTSNNIKSPENKKEAKNNKEEERIQYFERKQIKIKDDVNLDKCKFGDHLETTEGYLAVYISKCEAVICGFDKVHVHQIMVKTEKGLCLIEVETPKAYSPLNEID